MIRCAKCGKLYDYEKRNGICPECCRYNRPDSSGLEQELHERYDSTKRIHTPQGAHYRVHERNGERSAHKKITTATSRPNTEKAAQVKPAGPGRKKKKSAGGAIAFLVVVIFMIISSLMDADVDFDDIKQSLPWNQSSEGENTMGDSVEISLGKEDDLTCYVYMEKLGKDLLDVNWEDHYLYLDDDMEEYCVNLPELEGAVYYLVTLDINNNQAKDLDLTSVLPQELVFDEDLGLEYLQTIHVTDDTVEKDDFEFVDYIFTADEESVKDGGEVNVSGVITSVDKKKEYKFSSHVYY